jgi:hypothetical protein
LASHAGFALVASFSEPLVNSVIRVYHANLVPPLEASLPPVVTSGGTTINIAGAVVLLPPQVTLRANKDDLVQVSIGFAGEIVLSGGPSPGTYEVILTTDLKVGLFVEVDTVGTNQVITAGLDLSKASVDSLAVAVLFGNPLDPVYTAALKSDKVLDALTTALRSVPSKYLQATPNGFQLPTTVSQTYPRPGNPPAPDDNTLFQLDFKITRTVVKPVDTADKTSGALVIAVDLSNPAQTNGKASDLVDLNTASGPGGYQVVYNTGYVPNFEEVLYGPHNSDFASILNADVLTDAVNNHINQQVAGKFLTSNASFAPPQINDGYPPTYDCLNLSFGSVTPPFTSSLPSGMIIKVHAHYYSITQPGFDGYPIGIPNGDLDAYVTIGLYIQRDIFNVLLAVMPAPYGAFGNVSFKTAPAGGYMYVDTFLFQEGTFQLEKGTHAISADLPSFKSWTTTGKLQVDHSTNSSAVLTVKGNGSLTLDESQYDPFITQDSWAVLVASVDISLPWWVTLLNILLPIYEIVAVFADFFGADIWLSDIIATAESQVSGAGGTAIGEGLGTVPLFQHDMGVTTLPGTSGPQWLGELFDVVASSDGIATYFKTRLLPPDLPNVAGGAFPYLLVTDDSVSDPSKVPDVPGADGFPVRIDGSFYYPNVSWLNAPGSLDWDVHNLKEIGVVLRIPQGIVNPKDPSVFVTWTVKRSDTGGAVLSQTLSLAQTSETQQPLAISIDHASASLQSASQFVIHCHMFQPLGGSTPNLIFTAEVTIPIFDHYDRRHPYVQWSPFVKWIYPGQPFFAADLKAHAPGVVWTRKVRTSRIHRTDYWKGGHRCLVSDTSGFGNHDPYKLPGPGGFLVWDGNQGTRPPNYPWTYHDKLPISVDEIRRNRDAARGILCDYCFFGGPTKKTLRNDFPFDL